LEVVLKAAVRFRLWFPIDAVAAIAILMAAAFCSEMDMEDTGVSGRGVDLDGLRVEDDATGSGDTRDGGMAILALSSSREGLALKRTGRVRVRVDLRTSPLLPLFSFFVIVVE
jgi:hypothetical protein